LRINLRRDLKNTGDFRFSATLILQKHLIVTGRGGMSGRNCRRPQELRRAKAENAEARGIVEKRGSIVRRGVVKVVLEAVVSAWAFHRSRAAACSDFQEFFGFGQLPGGLTWNSLPGLPWALRQ
jgi:hypothetical protein